MAATDSITSYGGEHARRRRLIHPSSVTVGPLFTDSVTEGVLIVRNPDTTLFTLTYTDGQIIASKK